MGALHFFLGIKVCEFGDGLLLKQSKYIGSLLSKSELTEVKPTCSPMISSLKLTTRSGMPFENPTMYCILL